MKYSVPSSFDPLLQPSAASGSCVPCDLQFAHTHSLTATVMALSSCRKLAPTYLPRIVSLLGVIAVPKFRASPITRKRARRPVARDLNDRSLMRQFPWIFRKPFFPMFSDPSHGFLWAASVVLHGIRFRAFGLSRTRPFGSLWAMAAANLERDKYNSIRRGGRRRRYNLCAVAIQPSVLVSFSMVVLFCPLFTSLRMRLTTLTQ